MTMCAEYMNHYRNGDNFLGSDCLPVDCDNDHSENPEDWVTPEDVKLAFPGITFAVHYSRSHMREKNGKAPRPKFHVLFPIEYMTDAVAYSEMKKLVNAIFPYFDTKALDAARFFFGTANPEVELYPSEMTLSEYLSGEDFDADMDSGSHDGNQVIPEGRRNATMSRFAGRVIKKYGDSETAYQRFMEEAEKCDPPLEQAELQTIWHSAQKFYAKVQQQDGYVSPELYNDDRSYKPDDFSDVGQAEILAKHFSGELRYSPATHYIRYNGRYWQETEPGAQAVAHELTRRQLKESSNDMLAALATLKATGAQDILDSKSKAKAEGLMSEEQMEAYRAFLAAKSYQSYVTQRRASKNITAILKESRPMLEITPQDLDANPILLCTPDATYDLRLGMAGAREHSPEDFITKITTVSPGDRGKQIWLDCLDTIFCGDQELIDYVQMICGLAAVGKVQVEALIIAYGCGRNDKSTFWNSVSRVLGLYSGKVNEGEIPQYYVEGNHEAIISPEVFEMVQQEMERRNKRGSRSGVHLFSGKIRYGECGSWYGSKTWHSNDKYKKTIWQCNHKFDGDHKCTTPHLTDEDIHRYFISAVNQLLAQKDVIIASLTGGLALAFDLAPLQTQEAALIEEVQMLADAVEKCIYENAHVALDQTEYQKHYDGLVHRYDEAKAKLDAITMQIADKKARRATIEEFLKVLHEEDGLATDFQANLWCGLMDFMTVYSADDVRITFKNGTEIKA